MFRVPPSRTKSSGQHFFPPGSQLPGTNFLFLSIMLDPSFVQCGPDDGDYNTILNNRFLHIFLENVFLFTDFFRSSDLMSLCLCLHLFLHLCVQVCIISLMSKCRYMSKEKAKALRAIPVLYYGTHYYNQWTMCNLIKTGSLVYVLYIYTRTHTHTHIIIFVTMCA